MSSFARHPVPTLSICLLALMAIVSGESGHAVVFYICKPLTSFFIALMVWQTSLHHRYQKTMFAGMLFSLTGDIFLMLPERSFSAGFVCGLASFLFAHLCFLRALLSDSRIFGKGWIFALIATLGAINLSILWPGISNDLQIPVIAYVICLLFMTAQALSRWQDHENASTRWAALGGVLFMLSDTLLAYNRFYTPLPLPDLLVLLTYYSALWAFARSSQKFVVH